MIEAHTVLELRQYTTAAGRREDLMRLFRREFIAAQDALGARVLATCRDLDDPDRFVWLRAFRDMPARRIALGAFYSGEVWQRYRSEANATILDSDNVLLLAPLQALQSVALARAPLLRLSIHYLRSVPAAAYANFFRERIEPQIRHCGGGLTGLYITEPAANNFRLPVREDERVCVWFADFPDAQSEHDFSAALNARAGWRDGMPESLLPACARKPEVLRLVS